ncbi:ABC transporter family substrate-binding protein [Kitasatospora sp. McL0602]|uniref:ABC transporter family substrate-binding protein n=1 Tax=Kitasatospora sp. McL0602 TaxID=3439530 RepID=UPI003F8B1DED
MRASQVTAAALALLLAGALTACSEQAAPTRAASDITAADRSGMQDGGTLRWALDTVPTTLNVFQPEATADSELLAEAVLPVLFRRDEHAHPDADPAYLAAAESTPDGRSPQTVTYRLNPSAVWSDGTPLSAADFVAQWHALSGADPAFHGEHPAGYAAIAAVAQGADPHQVKVTFKQPYADWQALFSPLYPAAVTSTPAAFNQPLAAAFHTSAGPFAVRAYDAASGRVSLARNPRWWGDRAKAEAIDFLATPAAARLDALEHGKLDIAALTTAVDRAQAAAGGAAAAPPDAAALAQASAQALKRAESLPGLTLHRAPAAAFTQLTLNADRGPLADLAVRQAVAHAVDRGKAAAAALGPLGLPAEPLGNHLLMAGQEGYRDNSAAAGADSAATLLDRAGWRQSGSTRSKDGKELTLGLLVPDGSVTAERTAEALTASLAAVGVTLRPQAVPFEAFVNDHLATGDYDLALFSWPAATHPADEERPRYAKPRPGTDGIPVVGRNYARTGTEEIDQLFDRAAATLDPAARLALLQQADARIWQLAHSVPLYQRPDLVAVRSTVAGAGAFGFTTPRFADIGFRS